jgi:hypothetical protein
MIKIRISYVQDQEREKIIEALKGFKIIHIGKEYPKKGHKNMYLVLE